MTTSKDYIPKNAADFNLFQQRISTQVTANATLWNIPSGAATELGTRSTAYAPLYIAISNKETRSRQQMLAYKVFTKEYVSFLRTFCQSFLTNNVVIPVQDRTAMGLNPRGLNPPSERPSITTAPIVSVKAKGGGMVRFGFKVEAANKRNGRHPFSNGVMIFYRIVAVNAPVPPPPPTPVNPPVGENTAGTDPSQPANAAEGLPTSTGFDHYFSTRATFSRQLALTDIGKVLHVYAKWVNTTSNVKDGPYSMVATVVIS